MLTQTRMALLIMAVVNAWFLANCALAGSFVYTFDTKDSIDKWKANEGSKIEWQENGADTNSGCLKVAGGHTSVDSPRLKFGLRGQRHLVRLLCAWHKCHPPASFGCQRGSSRQIWPFRQLDYA